MEVSFTERFKKDFNRLPTNIQKSFEKRIVVFIKDPFHPSLKNHHLKGNLFGLRAFSLTAGYRVVFCFLRTDRAKLIDIGPHDKVYR